ncbi:myb-binding protein 1A [Hetaerina americana]|uniref:myb-binding protein 1A n=1 Tax=Hetaerina americana TaxID=62018 RepID=UPI003A7F4289
MDEVGTRGNKNFTGKRLEIIQSNTLEALRGLGKPSESQRIQAALSLFRKLSGKPYEHKNADDEEKSEVNYVLERLIRGVGASRNNSRTGYFAALVSMLRLFPGIPVKDVIELVKKELNKGKHVSKGEAADIHMGQVLVYGAIIRSGRFPDASEEDQSEILANLITAGGKRTYLTLVANVFIIQLIKEVNKKSFKKVIWPAIQESAGVHKDVKDRSLDELYLLLGLKNHFPKIISEENSIFHPDNIPTCASALMNIPNISYMKHPVYEEYCQQIASTEHVLLFWSSIEKHLVKPNRNRQLMTLEILKHIFSHLQDKTQFPAFISPPFINITLKSKESKRQSQDQDMSGIFPKVKEVFAVLMNKLLSEDVNDKVKVEMLKKLLFYPGNFMIEKNTGLKIVQPITTSLAVKGMKKLAKVYQDVVSGKTSLKEQSGNVVRKPDFKVLPWKNKERVYAAQLLARLVGVPVMASELEWKFKQAKFLLHWGVFSKQNSHSDEIGVVGLELSHALRESFFRCLDHKAGGLSGAINLLLKLVYHVHELLTDDSVEEKALKGKVLEDWEKAVAVIKKLEKQMRPTEEGDSKAKGEVGEVRVFLLLFLHLALQLFDWDAKLASESLEELYTCYSKMKQEKKQSKASGISSASKSKTSSEEAEGEVRDVLENGESENLAWVEVVVDLFLHLLSQNRHLLRSIVSSVFSHLCPHITATALHSILQVLDTRSGKNPLLEKDDDDESEGGENSEDEDKSDDEENGEVNTGVNDCDEADGDEEMSGEESEGSAEGEDEPTVNETLRLAVHKALGTAAPSSDTESVDVDKIGEEEGQQLDEALSNAFRLLKEYKNIGKSKKQPSKDEKMLTHFRVRVVDLLIIYLESTPSMALCCDLIFPLLESLEFCIKDAHQKPLENKLRSCFQKLGQVKFFSSSEGMNETILCDVLKALLDKGSKTSSIYLEMGNEIMNSCKFVVKSSQYLRKESEKNVSKKSKKSRKSEVDGSAIAEIYRKSLETFFTKRDCLLPIGMFRHALQVPWPGRRCMLPLLVQYGFDKDVRPFRRNQALQLLGTFFSNLSSQSNSNEINKEELLTIKEEISSQSKQFMESIVENKDASKLGKNCLAGLMSLLQAIKSCEQQHSKVKSSEEAGEEAPMDSGIVLEGMDWDGLGVLLSALYSAQMKFISLEGKKTFRKLLNSLGLGEVIARHQAEKSKKAQEAKASKEVKENGEGGSDSEEGEESGDEKSEELQMKVSKEEKEKEKREKKKKRKKSSKIESRKQKKEAKEFRMQEFSKGLEGSSFAGMSAMPASVEDEYDGAKDNSLVEEKSVNKGKKRKSDSPAKKAKRVKAQD